MPLAIMAVVAGIGIFAAYRMTKTKRESFEQADGYRKVDVKQETKN